MVNLTIYGQHGDGIYDSRIIGSERDGGFAEYAAVPAECALAVDSPLTDAELASFMCSYLTAEHMLSRVGLTRGESILITGASGGVGSALVQLALLRGARPVAQVGEGKVEPLRDLGVRDFIIRGREDVAQGVARICGPLSLGRGGRHGGRGSGARHLGSAQTRRTLCDLRGHRRAHGASGLAGDLSQAA